MTKALIIFLLIPFTCLGQFTITGKVLNHEGSQPLVSASVFLDNATIGMESDNAGRFTLVNIKPGKYELVVSHIGFGTYRQPIVIDKASLVLTDIILKPKTLALREVRIQSGSDAVWQRNFQWFKEGFLGPTDLAWECKIINPDVLNFNYRQKVDSLIAFSDGFLLVENKALGYKVKYLVDNFVRCDSGRKVHYQGSVLFENLKGTPSQVKRWLRLRREVYEGSAMHFLRSAIQDRLEEDGFRIFQYAIYSNPLRPTNSLIDMKIKIFRDKIKSKNTSYRDSLNYWVKVSGSPKVLHSLMNFPLKPGEFLKFTEQKGIFALGCDNDGLYVIYNKAHHFPKSGDLNFLTNPYNNGSTLVSFNAPFALFDSSGWIIEPNHIAFTGAWGKNRVAGLLPLDYDPSHESK